MLQANSQVEVLYMAAQMWYYAEICTHGVNCAQHSLAFSDSHALSAKKMWQRNLNF